jgi:hypothetical protein
MKNVRSKFLKNEVQVGLYIVLVALIVIGRAGIVDRSITVPLLLATLCAIYGLRHYVKKRYRDYVFESMRPEELPKDTYNFFNNHTPEFMQLGGGLLGDFRLSSSPYPVLVRYFLPPDDRVRGELCDWDGSFTKNFTTYFTDGRLIETVIMSPPGQKVSENSKLWFFKCSPCPIAELYQRHLEAIDAYQESHQATALKITPEILAELAQYGHRLVWLEKGILPPHIPEPRLPDTDLVPLRPAAITT